MTRTIVNRPLARFMALTLAMVIVTALAAAGTVLTPAAAGAAPRPDSASLRVERLYRAYFDRAPEPDGQSYWTGRLLSGLPLVEISDAFAESDEFIGTYGSLSNSEFVERVYLNVLDRSAEPSGLDYWSGELASGRLSRGEVMTGFSESAEFVISLGHLDPGQVKRLYRAFFLRDADGNGLAYWYSQQIAGTTLAEIAEQFASQAEFVERYGSLTDSEFVQLVYQNVLGREPDAGGLAHWTAQLAAGSLTRGEVMIGFSESPEFSGNPAPSTATTVGGCSLFPSDSFWYASAAGLPVLAQSDAYVNRLGASKNAHADFGAGLWDGSPIGIPYTLVDGPGHDKAVTFDYEDESDPSPYPVPRDAPVEGGSDRHVLVVDSNTCVLHELFAVSWQPDDSIAAGGGARWDLASNSMRPDGWTSSDAAGLPILPGLVRYEEVESGSIDHVVRITANVTDDSYVWPASHRAGSDGADRPPMGSWLRLKDSVDPDDFTGQARIIVVALQEHGAILADNGSSWFVSGAPDERWDNDDLRQLHDLSGSMFEFVDASSLQVAANSYEAQGQRG